MSTPASDPYTQDHAYVQDRMVLRSGSVFFWLDNQLRYLDDAATYLHTQLGFTNDEITTYLRTLEREYRDANPHA